MRDRIAALDEKAKATDQRFRDLMAEQRKRLEKEREQLEKNIANSTRQLGDETFLSRAPAHVVESIKTKLVDYETQLAKVRKALNGFSA